MRKLSVQAGRGAPTAPLQTPGAGQNRGIYPMTVKFRVNEKKSSFSPIEGTDAQLQRANALKSMALTVVNNISLLIRKELIVFSRICSQLNVNTKAHIWSFNFWHFWLCRNRLCLTTHPGMYLPASTWSLNGLQHSPWSFYGYFIITATYCSNNSERKKLAPLLVGLQCFRMWCVSHIRLLPYLS